jgi:hypothetical protein
MKEHTFCNPLSVPHASSVEYALFYSKKCVVKPGTASVSENRGMCKTHSRVVIRRAINQKTIRKVITCYWTICCKDELADALSTPIMDESQIYAIYGAKFNIPYIYVYIRIRIIYAIYGQPTLHMTECFLRNHHIMARSIVECLEVI